MAENPDSRPGSLSRSRSRSRDPTYSTGRGGAGNIVRGGPSEKDIEELDESERAAHLHPLGLYVSSPLFFVLGDHLTGLFPGTPSAVEAQGTLPLTSYRTSKMSQTRMTPTIRTHPMCTTPNPPVVAALGISRMRMRPRIRTTTTVTVCRTSCTASVAERPTAPMEKLHVARGISDTRQYVFYFL
jgi:hypothetical protein